MVTAAMLLVVATQLGCASRIVTLGRDHIVGPSQPSLQVYVESLLKSSRVQGLSAQPAWRKLLHYQQRWDDSIESQADGPAFFLSARGKVSPREELESTLRGFFSTLAADSPKDTQHPICQFPARFLWLSQQLAFDATMLPPHDCHKFGEFQQIIDAKAATLIFSSYYLNNPASAFGHTFLRFTSHRSQGGPDNRELLDYAVNFTAAADTTNAVLYAVKGIFGAFPGEFSRVPYYMQVRKYNDFESRDLWSYELALTDQELAMLVAHVWELGSTWFDYYYATENCSYHILGALEGAIPRLNFAAHTRIPVTPADTVKLVVDTPGLVTGVTFRPAIRAQIAARVALLSNDEQSFAVALAADPTRAWPATMSPEQRAATADAAADLIDMKYAKELPFNLEGEGAQRKQELLIRRAELGVRSEPLQVRVPHEKRPERGHGSRRVGLAMGGDRLSANGDVVPSVGMNVRLTLHDLADPADGYPDYAALEFLPISIRLRRFPQRWKLTADDAQLVRIVSLSPLSRFEQRMSWKFAIGAVHLDDSGCRDCTAARVGGGAGFALATAGAGLTWWFTTDVQLETARGLTGMLDKPLRIALGPASGLRLRLGDNAALLMTGHWLWQPLVQPLANYEIGTLLRWRVGQTLGLQLQGTFCNATTSVQLGFLAYY
jgi:hypothetical protein